MPHAASRTRQQQQELQQKRKTVEESSSCCLPLARHLLHALCLSASLCLHPHLHLQLRLHLYLYLWHCLSRFEQRRNAVKLPPHHSDTGPKKYEKAVKKKRLPQKGATSNLPKVKPNGIVKLTKESRAVYAMKNVESISYNLWLIKLQNQPLTHSLLNETYFCYPFSTIFWHSCQNLQYFISNLAVLFIYFIY